MANLPAKESAQKSTSVLLTYWPEIEEMRQSQPPRTRKFLLEWLEKEEGKQLVRDEKVFYALCDDIGLDLTIPAIPLVQIARSLIMESVFRPVGCCPEAK